MIFEDPSRRRWRRARVLLLMAGVCGLVLLSYLAFQILTGPPRPRRISSALEPAHRFLDLAWTAIIVLFSTATAIAVARVAFLGSLLLRPHRYNDLATRSFRPPVTVLIPAYNEAEVVAATVDAVLACDYPELAVIVIDDGSTDETAVVVAPYELAGRPLRLLRKPNGGKHSALNLGFEEAATEYVVTIDADTRVLEDTISRIMAPFADAKVDAVCGNVQVGNVRNALTIFQDVEYVTSQNYERRAFDALNCIPVVPGATGAWRRSTVLGSGGYSADTLTEDTDLTLTVLAAGGRIVYAPAARSITEAPEDAVAFFKQRSRWCFGTSQCLWKHRRHLGRGMLGRVALPNLLVFQILFPVLCPIADLALVCSAFRGGGVAIVAWYFGFLAIELGEASVAFTLERRRWDNLWVVLIQRFCYRQFMYFVTIRALFSAIKGDRQRWNKLDRRASVGIARIGEMA